MICCICSFASITSRSKLEVVRSNQSTKASIKDMFFNLQSVEGSVHHERGVAHIFNKCLAVSHNLPSSHWSVDGQVKEVK